MLEVRRDQMLSLQAHLDAPLVEHYCTLYQPTADDVGLAPPDLRARVIRGLHLGRELEAADGFELDAVVALTAFHDPRWAEDQETRLVLQDESLSRGARLRLVFTVLTSTENG